MCQPVTEKRERRQNSKFPLVNENVTGVKGGYVFRIRSRVKRSHRKNVADVYLYPTLYKTRPYSPAYPKHWTIVTGDTGYLLVPVSAILHYAGW